ncbi:hypothetical protein [Mucilaginibacter sp.]|uniref:hypothetical protein n=1 Tax=Mucilaginibacter sp. TaxID=1882438 RepID=UPI000CBD6C0D|nr:hypothetical protein [Mucilaginibacter sp.]PLW90002.1 MAG: hypothetical protein C0154_08750 [Mucilaginibacter sp.]PMP65796.1 MAG: hypothetical protein C0191_02740 [Mucilaginibacter sp.]
MDTLKFNKIIPIGRQEFAYQCENVGTPCIITGSIPHNNGSQPYPNEEKELIRQYGSYEIRIERFTGNSLTVSLFKNMKDGSVKCYQTSMSFAQLANQIFAGVEVNEYSEDYFGNSTRNAASYKALKEVVSAIKGGWHEDNEPEFTQRFGVAFINRLEKALR